MTPLDEQFVRRMMNGEDRRASAGLLRATTAIAEPIYANLMRLRNCLYASHILRPRRLNASVISVGNITAGGTGKTPCVQWLYRRLRQINFRPAILLRGYRKNDSAISDEEILLRGSGANVIVAANPDRYAAGSQILKEHPEVNAFILDDGFQHRKLARDFELLLIDATNPFGYGHVHPRGLLREPLDGVARVDAIILTRSDLVPIERIREIETTLIGLNHTAPIYRARHALVGLRSDESREIFPLNDLKQHRFFAAAGIANPQALHEQLKKLPGEYAGYHWFADHHDYSQADLDSLRQAANDAGANTLLITEKDWPKIQRLLATGKFEMPIWRLVLEFHLEPTAADGLIQLILTRLEKSRQK